MAASAVGRQVEQATRVVRMRRELPSADERRAMRVKAGMTQQQVASIVGVSRSTISRYEAGVRIGPRDEDALERYAAVVEKLSRDGDAE